MYPQEAKDTETERQQGVEEGLTHCGCPGTQQNLPPDATNEAEGEWRSPSHHPWDGHSPQGQAVWQLGTLPMNTHIKALLTCPPTQHTTPPRGPRWFPDTTRKGALLCLCPGALQPFLPRATG